MPIKDMPARFVESGRIRFGKKSKQGHPTSLARPRVTSPDRALLEKVASVYGGQITVWKDPGHDEFQVELERQPLRLVIPLLTGL